MSEVQKILEPYKLHHKDLDVCFNDAVAVASTEQALYDLLIHKLDADFFKTVTVEPHQKLNEAWASKVVSTINALFGRD